MSQHQNINSSSANNTLSRQRSNGKGKFLTRSHAMRESTSPPRTPTPRAGNQTPSTSSPNEQFKTDSHSRNPSTSPVTVNSQQQQPPSGSQSPGSNLFATNGNINVTQLDLEFPKLTPPKSKSPRNNNNINSSGSCSSNNNNSTNNNSVSSSNPNNNNSNSNIPGATANAVRNEMENKSSSSPNGPVSPSLSTSSSTGAPLTPPVIIRTPDSAQKSEADSKSGGASPAPGSQVDVPKITTTSASETCPAHAASEQQRGPTPVDGDSSDKERMHESNESLNRKNRNGPNAKGGPSSGGKPRPNKHNSSLEIPSASGHNQTSQSDYNDGSDHLTDQNGVDLLQFFKITLNKNAKDRSMLLRIEKDLAALIQDDSRDVMKFPSMSSYNRMLIHRVAAWFGMEHNVDPSLQCVIVGTIKTARIPEIRFKNLLSDTFTDESLPRKSILKRDAHSFEDYHQGLLDCPDRSMLDRKAKSFEEREQEYERAKRRIFKEMDGESIEQFWHNYSSGSDHYSKFGGNSNSNKAQNNRLLKSIDARYDGRPSQVAKSHSFGGYGPQSQARLSRGDSVNSTKSAGPTMFNKQDTGQQPWRLSPSSSGYKTQSQSVRSESITPSPSCGSASGEHTPEPASSIPSGVVWAVTDMASVPKGSVLIDPQTLQPIVNQDGSIYHFDPTNLPQCNKLQIVANASPTPSTTPAAASPNSATNEAQAHNQRRKFKPKANATRDADSKCDSDSDPNRGGTAPEIEISPTVSLNESSDSKENDGNDSSDGNAANSITMNTLLAPLNQIQQEEFSNSADNESDDIGNSSDLSPSAATFLNTNETQAVVRNQSTSPNIPDVKPSNENENAKENEFTNSEPAATTGPPVKTSKSIEDTASAAEFMPVKKDEIKMMPAVVPMLGYAATAGPNVYPPIESGMQMFPGSQPGPTGFPTTTYQQGLDGSVYAVSQPMIYGYPTAVEGDYPGLFVPMYDQNGQPTNPANALVPTAVPPAQSSSTIYPSSGATMAVLPMAYSSAAATAANPYGTSPNIYPGQVIYTSDQFNPATSSATQPQPYINFPISYTYPYNGSSAYPAYWSQAMTYYVPQQLTTHGASSVLPSPSTNGPNHLLSQAQLSASHSNANAGGSNPANGSSHNHGGNSHSHHSSGGNSNTNSHSGHGAGSKSHSNSSASHASQAHPAAQSHTNTPTIPASGNAFPPTPSADSKGANFSTSSPPNVFQYPSSSISGSASNYSSSVNTQAQTPANNRGHYTNSPPSASANETPSQGAGNKPNSYAAASAGSNAVASQTAAPPSSHNVKNNPPLFPTPNILPNGIVPLTPSSSSNNPSHINHSQESSYADGNGGQPYERKKNPQNNRKAFAHVSGGYRPMPGSNPNYVNSSNQSMHQSNLPMSSSGSGPMTNPRKGPLMPQPQQDSGSHPYNANTSSHNGNRSPPNSYNRNAPPAANPANPSGAPVNEHNDKRPNSNRINSHMGNKGGTPLISALPMNNVQGSYDRPRAPRPKPLDLRRSTNSSSRNTPSTNSMESNNNSPNSIISGEQQSYQSHHGASHSQHASLYISRGAHPAVHSANAIETCSPLAYNPHSGMYVKLGGQTYITHSMTFPNKPHQGDVRQQPLQPLTGIYPAMNMMLTGFPPTTRPLGPRPSHVNPNYKGNRAPR